MAEAKNTAETKDKARVLAGTFPEAATDQAKKLLSGMEAAGLKGYKMGAGSGSSGLHPGCPGMRFSGGSRGGSKSGSR